jgi:hypothetical protein
MVSLGASRRREVAGLRLEGRYTGRLHGGVSRRHQCIKGRRPVHQLGNRTTSPGGGLRRRRRPVGSSTGSMCKAVQSGQREMRRWRVRLTDPTSQPTCGGRCEALRLGSRLPSQRHRRRQAGHHCTHQFTCAPPATRKGYS